MTGSDVCEDRHVVVARSEGDDMKERWEAGDMGCGQLVVELRRRLDHLNPGDMIEVIAHDPGARTDLPAWCRMTGNKLISADPPVYTIMRKAD